MSRSGALALLRHHRQFRALWGAEPEGLIASAATGARFAWDDKVLRAPALSIFLWPRSSFGLARQGVVDLRPVQRAKGRPRFGGRAKGRPRWRMMGA